MDRVTRTYDISALTHEWLQKHAAGEGRSVIRQVEVIIEEAKKRDEQSKG